MIDLRLPTSQKPEDQIPHDNYTCFIIPFSYSFEKYHCDVEKLCKKAPRFVYADDSLIHKEKGGLAASYLSAIDDMKAALDSNHPMFRERVLSSRESYILRETRLTLFKRARWFRLQDSKVSGSHLKEEFHLTLCEIEDEKIQSESALVANVELVLFEAPFTNKGRRRAQRETDPHSLGFLIFATHVSPGGSDRQSRSRFDHLLICNERLRYITLPPYDKVEALIRLDLDKKEDVPEKMLTGVKSAKLWEWLLKAPLDTGKGLHRLAFTNPFPAIELPKAGTTDEHPGSWRYCVEKLRRLMGKPRSGSNNGSAFSNSYPDNRAFVYTFGCLGEPSSTSEPIDLSAEAANDDMKRRWQRAWFSLLDVDGPDTARREAPLTEYERDWLERHTYQRWREGGTVYGFTSFSAAQLRQADAGFALSYYHFRQMYLDQFLLLLYERVTLFQFSTAISAFSHEHVERKSHQAAKQFNTLRQQFMLMTNLYRFPMFTTQQQGLEMYALAQDSLDIKELYDEISAEIHETEAFFAQQRDEMRNDQLAALQRVGALVAFVGLAAVFIAIALAGLQVLEFVPEQWKLPGNLIGRLTIRHQRLDLEAVRTLDTFVIASSVVALAMLLFLTVAVLGKNAVRWIWRQGGIALLIIVAATIIGGGYVLWLRH